MSQQIPEHNKISPFLVFFIIHAMQVGIGILGFQRNVAMTAGYDGWISIIVTGAVIHLLIWMIYKMNKIADGDLNSIHTFIFGKKISKFFSALFILYFCLITITVLRSYIEIIQVWMFPSLATFWFGLVFMITVVYIINGGFRTVTGIAFFSILLPFYVFFVFFFTFPFADITNLLPIFDHSAGKLLKGSQDLSLSVLGFETLLVFYPFIKEPDKSKKWAYGGNLATTLLYLYLAIIAYIYFPESQLQKNIWPTLTMWKIIKFPFVERFEYIGIANWCLIILPNACISLWCASRLVKSIFSVRQKTSVPIMAFLCLTVLSMFTTRSQINYLTDFTGKIGFYLNFAYLPLLFFATLIAKRVRRHDKKT